MGRASIKFLERSVQHTRDLIQKLDQQIEDGEFENKGWTDLAIAIRGWVDVELKSQQQSLIQLKESEEA